jgi:hypothetical protein
MSPQRMQNADAAWLRMDRAPNLMVVNPPQLQGVPRVARAVPFRALTVV